MKLSVTYDSQGKILAAFAMEPHSPFRVRAEMGDAFSEDIELPAEFHGKKLHEFLHNLSVDVSTRRLVKKKM